MAFLLDTNVLLWAAIGKSDLGRTAANIVMREPNLYYSAISVAEITMKQQAGKLRLASSFVDDLAIHGFKRLGFNDHHALTIARFGSLVGHDPFDRLIVAQAAAENYRLVTADRMLLSLGFDWILDARI